MKNGNTAKIHIPYTNLCLKMEYVCISLEGKCASVFQCNCNYDKLKMNFE